MLNRFRLNAFILLGFAVCVMMGCQPRTAAEKVEDKVEDAAHEAGQAMERTGERIEEKAN